MAGEEDLPDFDEEGNEVPKSKAEGSSSGGAAISSSGFRDFLIKDELMQAVVECGFEHPSEVQHACIPQALLGTDILCQAKSGMGKTAVFVIGCLQTVDFSVKDEVRVLVLCHVRELAFQIEHEFKRFAKHFKTTVKIAAFMGGSPIEKDKERLKSDIPHIVVGTPGRVLWLAKGAKKDEPGPLKLGNVSHFVVDECDKCIDDLVLRKDVQQVFIRTPKKKQVMMYSATLSADTRMICKKFMTSPHEITVESEATLTLHGLLQYYVKLEEKEKNKKLVDLLDSLEFNQVVIFVKSPLRAQALDHLLQDCNFPSMTLHPLPKKFSKMAKPGDSVKPEATRLERLQQFKDFQKRILVTTDMFGRGMDVERINIVIQYDMPSDDTMYLHRVGRAGRFGTKGLAISFVSGEKDAEIMKKIQSRFEVNIGECPKEIDTTSYLNA